MATQTVTTLNHVTGISLTDLGVAADAALSDRWVNTGNELLWISNGGGSPITLTLSYGVGGTIDGKVLPVYTFSITNGKQYLMGPFPVGLYNDSNGFMNISYSAVTSVKILVFIKGT